MYLDFSDLNTLVNVSKTASKRNRAKGIKTPELVRRARKLSTAPRGQRTFRYPDREGYYSVGLINGDKINLTFHTEDPTTGKTHVKVRFQLYDNVDKAKIYATNTDRVKEAVLQSFGQKVYFYNEVAKKELKQQTIPPRVAKSKARPKYRETFFSRLKVLFRLRA